MYENTAAPTKSDFWLFMKWGAFIIALGLMAFLTLHTLGIVGTVASAPGRVVNKTLGTDNIITSYEWFFDTAAQYQSRVNQVRAHSAMVKAEPSASERARLNMELAAMRQSCRDLATKYNANAEKANKSVFKTDSTPPSLAMSTCEG